MIEQQPKEAGVLERAQVRILLRLEEHMEKKVKDVVLDRERREVTGKIFNYLGWGVTVASWGGVILMASKLIERRQEAELKKAYFGTDWQDNKDVLDAIEKAKKQDGFVVIAARQHPVQLSENIHFVLTSGGVVLAIDQLYLNDWLNFHRQKVNFQLGFTFNDTRFDPDSHILNISNVRVPVDVQWRNIKIRDKKQAMDELSYHLSSGVAVMLEYIRSFGKDEAMKKFGSSQDSPNWPVLTQDLNRYKQLIIAGKIAPFVRVVDINPLWIKEKLAQPQRP